MDARPPKRQRTESQQQSQSRQFQHLQNHIQPQQQPPQQHQFISDDGVTSKKPAKKAVTLSCAECRRLKLKCDRVFPCASCTKRGCAQICPNGVLVSGKGTRFILANTEQLHAKITQMSERIQLLEDALDSVQNEFRPGRAHPLLTPELKNIKSTIKLYATTQTGTDTDVNANAAAPPAPSSSSSAAGSPRKYGGVEAAFPNHHDHDHGGQQQQQSTHARDDSYNSQSRSRNHSSSSNGNAMYDSAGNGHSLGQPSSPVRHYDSQGHHVDVHGNHLDPHGRHARDDSQGHLRHARSLLNYTHPINTTSSNDNNNNPTMHVNSSPISTSGTTEIDYAGRVTRLSHDFPMLDHDSPWTPYEKQHRDDRQDQQYDKHSRDSMIVDSPGANVGLREYLRSKLPSRQEAFYLWEAARENALWQYNPHPDPSFIPSLIAHVYETPLALVCPRRLSLLFMLLALGTLVDLEQPAESPQAEKYHALSRASLCCEVSILEDVTIDTIFTLFYMTWYLLVFSDKKKAAGHAFGLAGLNAKLAVSIGLHRESKFKSSQEDLDRRRSLTWELLYLDARLSLSLGRPPSLCFMHMDCKRPIFDPPESSWKHSCYVNCLSPVLELISSPNVEYSAVMDLDRKIRDFAIPPPPNEIEGSRTAVLRKASFSTVIETVLLQLHRSFFTRSLTTAEMGSTRKHQHAPSAVAVLLSASRMIATVEALWRREPQLSGRILWYWSNAFSAAVALCLLVCRVPFSCLAPAALQELQRAQGLFASAAAEKCPRAMQVIPVLESMMVKANDIYVRWARSYIPNLPKIEEQPPPTPTDGQQPPIAVAPNSYARAHPSLAQCLVEIHQRAKLLSPLIRTTCRCSATASSCFPSAPPRHPLDTPPDWSSPVLPALASPFNIHTEEPMLAIVHPSGSLVASTVDNRSSSQANGDGSYGSYRSSASPGLASSVEPPILPALNVGGVDALNIDFGATNPEWTDHGIMAWF